MPLKVTTMKVFSLISIILCLFTACKQKSAEDQVVEWISDNAVPINTVEAGNSFEDLLPWGEMVGEARIVSLGEPTHGNREVFQLKHRLIEYLVTEKGFNLFALECPFGEAFDVNQYILEGIGTPEEALAGIYYWTWDTQEIVELLKWMQKYNADSSHVNKIKFYGFDTQDPERASRVMFEYLNKVDPALKDQVRPELGILEVAFSNPEIGGRRQYIPEEYDSLSLQNIRRVINSFDSNKAQYVQKSSLFEWTFARQHVRQAEIWIEACINNGENYDNMRDLGQAQNLKWIMDQEPPSSKMIVWAHNSHVSNFTIEGYEFMGSHMKKWYEEKIKIFGVFFNQGGFTAFDSGDPSTAIHPFSVGPAPDETLESKMVKSKNKLAILDLSKLPENGVVHDWFNQEQPTRNSGGGYNENDAGHYFVAYNLSEAFDALIFIDSTSEVQYVNDMDFDILALIYKELEGPSNTGFENNSPGELPDDWVAWSKFKRVGVDMIVTDENPFSGKNSAMLQRKKNYKFGEITPSLRQYIDAAPYRGKKIRLSFAARAELDTPGFAFSRLCIDPSPLSDAHNGLPPFFDSLDEHRIDSEDWKIYEIEAQVDDEAGIIHYGVYLRDFGTIWLDDVEVEIIE